MASSADERRDPGGLCVLRARRRGRSPRSLTLAEPPRIVRARLRAEVAELADALDSGSSARKGVGVQIPPSAPFDPHRLCAKARPGRLFPRPGLRKTPDHA